MIEKIIILDFGSQVTQLIARRIRELNVYSEVHPCTTSITDEHKSNLKGIILSGGPASVMDDSAPEFDKAWLSLGVPVLGICYGMHVMAHLLGGKMNAGQTREFGYAKIRITGSQDSIFAELGSEEEVWMSHGDSVTEVPNGFSITAHTENNPVVAMSCPEKSLYAVQYHPEVVHTKNGKQVYKNFLEKICNCEMAWTPTNFIAESIEKIKAQVDSGSNVICALSGGVDSTVAALLVSKALGDNLKCIFVDNGLLRLNERDEVESYLNTLGLNLEVVDAREQFLTALKGVTDPEKKRKIIGHEFIEVFDEASKKIENVTHLVQGTLYPDVIESLSSGGPSETIKTHHNVGGLPEKMKLKLIEPFRKLFKDEVREIGRELGLVEELIKRHPFPGPGLAVRCLGEVTEEKLKALRLADSIFHQEIKAFGIYDEIWQSLAVHLPINSTGVMGDGRTYENCIALRAVTSEDVMTADWYGFSDEFLRKVSSRIINEVKGINRVVYDISSKPPATIEWE